MSDNTITLTLKDIADRQLSSREKIASERSLSPYVVADNELGLVLCVFV